MLGASFHQALEHVQLVGGRAPDLVSEIAGVAHTTHDRRGEAEWHATDIHEPKRLVGQIHRGQ